MQAFQAILSALASIPAWAPLFLYPAVLVAFTVVTYFLGGRGAYPYVAIALGGASFTLLCARGALSEAFAFLGLYAALAALLRFVYFCPRHRRARRKKLSRDERMYQKFCAPSARETPAHRPSVPPKVCKFEEDTPVASAKERGMQLKYAEEMLGRLKKCALTPADRLEAEALSRTLAAYGAGPLTEAELNALGDCLASILKMTAKYKL